MTQPDPEGRPHGTDPVCDPALPNGPGRVPHDYAYVQDEYGSLASGGDFEEYRCRRCGRYAYVPLPD